MTVAAAKTVARRSVSHARARKPARPVSHLALAFPPMTMAAMAPPPLPT
jgi:hypothetical protein